MKKFFVLIKKELRELLTPQVLAPMLITILIFVFIGKVAGGAAEKAKRPTSIAIIDLDKSQTSKNIIELLSKNNFSVKEYSGSDEAGLISFAKNTQANSAIEIPAGFEAGIEAHKQQNLKTFTVFKNFSFSGSKDAAGLDTAIALINTTLSSQLIQATSGIAPQNLMAPIIRTDTVVVGPNEAKVSPAAVISFVSGQTALIPIILFIVIIFAATMIATAIATEKENKTLETLLTAPVDRKFIVSAKMVGAGLVALVSAAVYMFGFRFYMNGISSAAGVSNNADLSAVVNQLGLKFDITGYLLLGGTLFLGILCALAIATILGAFAEDAKSVQGLISPLMILIMIPYFLTMFLDLGTLSNGIKILVYAIPFSYPFLAAPNIFLHNYSVIIYGMIYQLLLFVIFVYIAAKIFSTDKIVTMKLNFRKTKK